MVKFQISLRLHNYNDISLGKYSKLKTKKIQKFYQHLGKLIKNTHNGDVLRTRKIFKQYYEPLVKIDNIIFTEPESDNPLDLLVMFPTIDMSIEFKMKPEQEEQALKQFYKDYKGSMQKKSYKELKSLYYSSKIIQFVDRLKVCVEDGMFWRRYTSTIGLKTKYKPSMALNNTAVLSLT
jgi:hypothetical protein